MVLLDYFESDILTFLSDFLATVGSFLFRFFQISFTCGISTSFFQVLEHGFWQVILSLFGCEILASGFEPF
ncbi:uncharacterized protein OCT59_029910 [Rhizophagus irregularis]|uniref:uncharacterized protein n=1 Tax=Rhizophagus irregularis TaxID=588596 RepID=UPI00332FAB31|nr:hypothetical protein OCT59_029910 [Rhizophagus irregularis]